MKKYISFLLVLTFIFASLCSCGNNVVEGNPSVDIPEDSDDIISTDPVTPDYLKHESIDATSLTLENSPIEFSSNNAAENHNLGLDLSVTNSNGEKVLLDDILFVLERKSANGMGETVLESVFEGDNANVRFGPKISATVGENGVDIAHSANSNTIKFIDYFHFDPNKEYVISLNIDNLVLGTVTDSETNTPGWDLMGTVKYDAMGNWTKKSSSIIWIPVPEYDSEGSFTFYVSDMVRSHLAEMDEDPSSLDIAILPILNVRGDGTSFTIKDLRISESEKGFVNSQNAANVAYFTDGIESTLKFTNGTGVQTFDYYSNEYTVARKLTLSDDGLLVIGGKVYGNVSYDGSEYAVTANYKGVEYVVTSSRMQRIEFFDSEEDLHNGNGTATPTENTKYWIAYCSDFKVGESLYMAVSANAENSEIDLVSTARYAIDAYYRIEK